MMNLLDMRTSSMLELSAAPALTAKEIEQGLVLNAWQVAALQQQGKRLPGPRTLVTVPDFLNYARMLNTGQGIAMAKLSGSLVRSAFAGMKASLPILRGPLAAARMDFWLIAEVLLRYDLALLPGSFSGTLMLHSHVTDFACVFEKRSVLQTFFNLAAGRRAGFHTQQLPAALSCASRWQIKPSAVAYLDSPANLHGELIQAARQSTGFSLTAFIPEIGSWPTALQDAPAFAFAPDDREKHCAPVTPAFIVSAGVEPS